MAKLLTGSSELQQRNLPYKTLGPDISKRWSFEANQSLPVFSPYKSYPRFALNRQYKLEKSGIGSKQEKMEISPFNNILVRSIRIASRGRF